MQFWFDLFSLASKMLPITDFGKGLERIFVISQTAFPLFLKNWLRFTLSLSDEAELQRARLICMWQLILSPNDKTYTKHTTQPFSDSRFRALTSMWNVRCSFGLGLGLGRIQLIDNFFVYINESNLFLTWYALLGSVRMWILVTTLPDNFTWQFKGGSVPPWNCKSHRKRVSEFVFCCFLSRS